MSMLRADFLLVTEGEHNPGQPKLAKNCQILNGIPFGTATVFLEMAMKIPLLGALCLLGGILANSQLVGVLCPLS